MIITIIVKHEENKNYIIFSEWAKRVSYFDGAGVYRYSIKYYFITLIIVLFSVAHTINYIYALKKIDINL